MATLDGPTNAVYEARAKEWAAARTDTDLAPARRLADVGPAAVLDLGCGPGYHLPELAGGVGLDPAAAMLGLARERAPQVPLVQGEAAALPFVDGAFAGALVSKVYVHIDRPALPLVLAELHRVLAVGSPAELVMFGGDADLTEMRDGDFAGRRFSQWGVDALTDALIGAGFAVERFDQRETSHWPRYDIGIRRLRTLPDTVGAGMELLICGLNPSLHAADMGVGFGRPGNRFWPAALAAGIARVDRDPRHALLHHAMGMTDLVKRATTRADEVTSEEFVAGVERLDRLCGWLRPRTVCVVGLTGWRQGVDRSASPGWQDRSLGDTPVYLMPSTSGLNAHAQLPDLTDHLRRAAAGR